MNDIDLFNNTIDDDNVTKYKIMLLFGLNYSIDKLDLTYKLKTLINILKKYIMTTNNSADLFYDVTFRKNVITDNFELKLSDEVKQYIYNEYKKYKTKIN